MSGASTIVIAREDLSIPDEDANGRPVIHKTIEVEQRFFSLLRDKRPDVIILDFRKGASNGVQAIQKIRRRSDIPVVVMHPVNDKYEQDYRIAGAVECLTSPVDIILLNSVIQRIKRVNSSVSNQKAALADTFEVSGMIFRPRQNAISANGASIQLTTAENHLLLHLVSRPWTVCRRTEIAEVIYNGDRPASDRAIDVVVTRLRKKLTALRGLTDNLIKTEFRTGYMFVGDVSKTDLLGSGQQA